MGNYTHLSSSESVEVALSDHSLVSDHELQAKRLIEILVNKHPVTLKGKRHTGLEIKEAAIRQNVAIQLDFVLSMIISPKKTKIIGDGDSVNIEAHSEFIAIADDDNS